MEVTQLVDELGVTATAVRQRLVRLLSADVIDRTDTRKGRGRPVHHYRLTKKGYRLAGDNMTDLALVLWDEINQIADAKIRRAVISGAIGRLTEIYTSQIEGDSLEARMRSVAELFQRRQIPLAVEQKDGKPVLRILGCPYPELAGEDNQICELEKQLFSQLTDRQLNVDRCQCGDAGGCCTFQEVGENESVNLSPSP